MNRNPRLVPCCALLLLTGLLSAGCSTTSPKPAPAAGKSAQAESKVEGVGSWIPRKVKSKKDVIGDGTATTDSEMLVRANARGATNVPKGN